MASRIKRDELLLKARQAEIDALHARYAAQDAQTGSDRDYTLVIARTHERRAWNFRRQADLVGAKK